MQLVAGPWAEGREAESTQLDFVTLVPNFATGIHKGLKNFSILFDETRL